MSTIRTVLVLGAYGGTGRAIVDGLLAKAGLCVIASGRDSQKLEMLARRLAHPRLSTLRLDAYDAEALSNACADADLVINAVGPYAIGGFEIARAVLDRGLHYMDFANELSHYRRLATLDEVARGKGVLLLTGAGLVPGLSALIAMHLAERLPDAQQVEVYYGQARVGDGESGLGSLLGGVLELSAVGGRLESRVEKMPPPFGDVRMVAIPTLEALTIPKCISADTVEHWWVFGKTPKGAAVAIGLLKPHERDWAYRLMEKLTRWTMRRADRYASKKGLTTEGVMKVVVRSRDVSLQAVARVEDGGVATAYLPVLAAKRLAEGRLELVGLRTPVDVFEPDATFRELEQLGWRVAIQEWKSEEGISSE